MKKKELVKVLLEFFHTKQDEVLSLKYIFEQLHPVSYTHLYGRDTATMVEAARIVEQAHPDTLDINFGCPVKRVAGKGAGANYSI